MNLKRSLAVAVVAALTLLVPQVPAHAAETLADGVDDGGRTAAVARPSAPAPARAGAAVAIGDPVISGISCGVTVPVLQVASSTVGYTVPGAGVLTSFTYAANQTPGSVRALGFTPGPASGHWTMVAKTGRVPVTPGALNTFPTRLPVPAGTTLGVQVSDGSMNCGIESGAPSDVAAVDESFDPDTETDLTGSFLEEVRVGIAATWEPDADRDGHGDVTQDACPQSAATQAACPAPDTKAKGKRPVTSTRNGTITIKFTSTVPGSTFTCAVDRKAAGPCSSPFRKRFSLGRHKVVVTAVSPAGIADPKPLTVKLRLRRG